MDGGAVYIHTLRFLLIQDVFFKIHVKEKKSTKKAWRGIFLFNNFSREIHITSKLCPHSISCMNFCITMNF